MGDETYKATALLFSERLIGEDKRSDVFRGPWCRFLCSQWTNGSAALSSEALGRSWRGRPSTGDRLGGVGRLGRMAQTVATERWN